MRTVTTTIPSGVRGTSRTIAEMHRVARDAIADPRTANLASQIIAALPRRDFRGEVQALLSYVQGQCRYVNDPHLPEGLERVQHPLVTLARGAGDCDCLSPLMAALAGSIGRPYAFRTIGTDATRPDEFQHVYTVIHVPNRGWTPADPSFEEPLGWEPARNGTLQLPDGTTVAAAEVVRDWLP